MFLVFEGLDGSGKSTLMRFFKEDLRRRGIEFIETFDPGATAIGDEIRKILLSKKLEPEAKSELLLYEASRVELVEKIMRPALRDKKWILSDRFYFSTTAFQGYGRGLDIESIEWLNSYATSGLRADFVFWVNTSVEECQKRMNQRLLGGEELSRLDVEKRDFHQRVYEGYKKMAEDKKSQTKWIELDGNKKPEEIYKDLSVKFWSEVE